MGPGEAMIELHPAVAVYAGELSAAMSRSEDHSLLT
jgi:hypothetical protein